MINIILCGGSGTGLWPISRTLTPEQIVVSVDPRYFRPTEVDLLLGDPTKTEKKLNWNREYNLVDLVNDMMRSDLKLMTKDIYLKEGGYKIMSYFE